MKVMVRKNGLGNVTDVRPYDPANPDVCWSSGEWSVDDTGKKTLEEYRNEAILPKFQPPEKRKLEDRVSDIEERLAKIEERVNCEQR